MTEKMIKREDCGLNFHVIPTDSFKMSRLTLNFIFDIDKKSSPMTKLMLAVLMRGCKKYPTMTEISRRLSALYDATLTWRSTRMGCRETVRITSSFLADKYKLYGDCENIARSVAEIMLDVLFDPKTDANGLFDEDIFNSEKKILLDDLRSMINDQQAYASQRCSEVMFEGRPYGFSIAEEEKILCELTNAEVSRHLRSFLLDSVIECYYAGSDDIGETLDMIADRFKNYGRSNVTLKGSESPFLRGDGEPGLREKSEEMNASLCRLNIGCTTGVVMSDPDYYAAVLFNDIFGGSSVSKLFINVRERKSLCYYCSSSYGSALGTLRIRCGIKPENRDKALEEIKHQLDEMKKGNFTEDDLKTAKVGIISELNKTYDSISNIISYKFRRLMAGIDTSVEDTVKGFESVTKEDILRVAERVKIDTVYFLCGSGEEECDDE